MREIDDVFTEIDPDALPELARSKREQGFRFVNVHACRNSQGEPFTLVYTFTKDNVLYENFKLDCAPDARIASISGDFPAAFFFENETHDLFGITFSEMALDYQGHFFETAQAYPMAIPLEEVDTNAVMHSHDIHVSHIFDLDDSSSSSPAKALGERGEEEGDTADV